MKPLKFCGLGLALFALPVSAQAEGLPVTPGLWKSTSTIIVSLKTVNPDLGGTPPETRTIESCIPSGANVLDAHRLAGPGCEPSDVTPNAAGISFVLVCQRAGMTLYGTMTASAMQGGTMTEAHMTLTGRRADGREVEVTADLVGERLGPCEG